MNNYLVLLAMPPLDVRHFFLRGTGRAILDFCHKEYEASSNTGGYYVRLIEMHKTEITFTPVEEILKPFSLYPKSPGPS